MKLITSDLDEQSRSRGTTVEGLSLLPVFCVVGTEVSDCGTDVDAVNVVNILTCHHRNQEEEEEEHSWRPHVRLRRRIVGLLQSPHD